jgi:hypothetical protein
LRLAVISRPKGIQRVLTENAITYAILGERSGVSKRLEAFAVVSLSAPSPMATQGHGLVCAKKNSEGVRDRLRRATKRSELYGVPIELISRPKAVESLRSHRSSGCRCRCRSARAYLIPMYYQARHFSARKAQQHV